MPPTFQYWLSFIDARYYQIAFLSAFLLYGISALGWNADYSRYVVLLLSCWTVQLIGAYFTHKPYNSILSATITALGLSLLCHTNELWVAALAGTLAVGSKFVFRYQKKHFFNPANFGLIGTILLTQQAWVSPGQWGSGAILLFLVGSVGMFIIFRVGRWGTALAFISTLFLLQYSRTILYLGWEHDFLWQQFSNGSLLLFTFFMITDPVSTPNHVIARIVWAVMIGVFSFILTNYYFVNASPVWVLFFLSPLTPFFDKLLPYHVFSWKKR
jgi:Na+-transporting NADH:ubiquinone oxidoreductase subunit NqrB